MTCREGRGGGERGAVTGLELVPESGGALINLHGSYRVALGRGCVPVGHPGGPSGGRGAGGPRMLFKVAGAVTL